MMALLGMSRESSLLLAAAAAVVLLILLIAWWKLNSFVALLVVSLFTGLITGLDLPKIATAFQTGLGNVLGSIAGVIGLGTILGKMLAESGGAGRVAEKLIGWFGPRRLPWAMLVIAFVIGIPVFFSVGLVLLIPLVFTTVRKANVPLLVLAFPLLAGLSVAHGLVPPHPGPMAAIGLLKANVGKTILYSLIIGFPIALVAGPLLGKFMTRRLTAGAAGEMAEQLSSSDADARAPGFAVTLWTILLPVLLMLLGSLGELFWTAGHPLRQIVGFVGHPLVALLLAVLLSFYTFGRARGFSPEQILQFTTECLGPIAAVLLVVGAGGGFNSVLVAAGVGEAITKLVSASSLSPLILAWLAAALIRIATGSATVAITTAAGLLAPAAAVLPEVNLELLVLAMGAGSLILSHVNDGGFWLVKEYLNLSVTQTLRTWTVLETVVSILGLIMVLLFDLIV